MLDRIVNVLSVAYFSIILFVVAYLIVDDYMGLHQRIDTLEQKLNGPIEITLPSHTIIPIPDSSFHLDMKA